MNEFGFYMPTQIVYGKGSLLKTPEYAAELGTKGLIVTDKGLIAAGVVEPLKKAFDDAGLACEIWSDIVPNPRDKDIERGAAEAAKMGIDYMVAVGGGSAIDTAKAMGAILTNGGKCEDCYGGKLTKPITPLIAVPTTCGTGSEVTHESIVNNTTTMVKDCIWGKYVSVSVAVLDPDMLKNLPPKVMAATGIDALTHAVEAYVCKAANPFTDALAIKSITMIADALIRGVRTKEDDALAEMITASCMAGAAFGNSDVASVHSIAEALGGFYDIAHGVANAMFLPAVSRLSIKGAPERYANVARALGVDTDRMSTEEAANAGVDRIQEMCDTLEIPKFSELTVVNPKDFPRLAHTAANAPETLDNPVLMEEEDFISLFQKLYHGETI
ncbi:MAG: iron-containing alcohol dehydrogenase [Bilifractor sp.]